VQTGDVVLSANGQRIDSAESLHNYEGLQDVGGAVTLDVRRDGKPLTLKAVLKAQPKAVSAPGPAPCGATFVDLPESLRQSGINGVLVSDVARGSRAASNGWPPATWCWPPAAANSPTWPRSAPTSPAGQRQLVLRVLRGKCHRQGQLVMR
jgi:serine protease Do